MDQKYDLHFPVSMDDHQRSEAQKWWYETQQHLPYDQRPYYLPEEWGVTGEVFIFTKERTVLHKRNCELRFGDHPYMKGFKLCLAVRYEDDDKFEAQSVRADWSSGTISGRIYAGTTFVFRPYLFQVSRLRRLWDVYPINGIDALIGAHMSLCGETLEDFAKIKRESGNKKTRVKK